MLVTDLIVYANNYNGFVNIIILTNAFELIVYGDNSSIYN